jgi:hypothetical protein
MSRRDDELDARIRSLQAERLRPVTPAPPRPRHVDAEEWLAIARILYRRPHTEPPGPRDPTEPTRKDR